jgi:hypothetical protein
MSEFASDRKILCEYVDSRQSKKYRMKTVYHYSVVTN